MAKYSKAAQEKISEVMHEFGEGKLKSSSGEKVTDRKQAIAIGISEAEDKGLKVPSKKSASKKAAPKTATKKAAPKKAAAKKATPAKASTKKAALKKSASKK